MSRVKLAALILVSVAGVAACEYPEQSLESDPAHRNKKTVLFENAGDSGLSRACILYVDQVKRLYQATQDYEAAKGDLTTVIDLTATALMTKDKSLQNEASRKLRAIGDSLDQAVEDMAEAGYAVENNGGRCEGS